MRRSVLVACVALVGVGVTPVGASAASRSAVQATVDGDHVTLANSLVRREWRVQNGLVTSALADPRARNWSAPASEDFRVTVDGVPLTSTSNWDVLDVRATRLGPARHPSGGQVTFRLGTPGSKLSGAGVEVDRTYTLRSGSAVVEVAATLVNRTPAPLRLGAYTLDELTSPATGPAEVHAYHGGSDWRDDYRQVRTEPSSFDDEGEVVRFDDGSGRGWFFVSERRGGAQSRVGRDAAGRTWTGVDDARDLFDAGPLATDPPNYNRVENPAYPVPVRQRTVAPLASFDLGRAYAGVYHDGAPSAAAAFTGDFVRHVMPPFPRTVGLNSFHPWSHGPEFNETTMLSQARAGKALGLETLMLDDQWQGGPGGESGDWQFDPVRFPDRDANGVPDFVEQLHAMGVGLGLWMSPVEFNSASKTYQAHPDWACAPTGHVTAQIPDDAGLGVWDVTNPGFRAYLTSVIDRAVGRWGVREFKFDFQAWVDCPPHDYRDYEDAFVSLVHSFEARHPDVTFELDETNDQRAWPFESAAIGPSWFDNGHLHGGKPVPKLLHDLWSAAPWLPPSSLGIGLYDGTLQAPYTPDYLMPIALLSHITFWTDVTKLTPDQAAATARWIGWYKQHRDELAGVAYELTTADPNDGTSWAVFQPWTGDHGDLFAFRQAGGPDTQTVQLQGVDAGRSYRLTDVRTGADLGTRTGAEIARGYTLTLPPNTAQVISVVPV